VRTKTKHIILVCSIALILFWALFFVAMQVIDYAQWKCSSFQEVKSIDCDEGKAISPSVDTEDVNKKEHVIPQH